LAYFATPAATAVGLFGRYCAESGLALKQAAEIPKANLNIYTPAVLVLGTIVHQEQQMRRGQIVDETVKQGLRLGVNSVQVFTDQEQRLPLSLAQQHAFEGFEGTLAALC
jgi:hypothetical protein